MKLIILIILISFNVFGQSNLTKKLFCQIIFEDIPVKNDEGKLLDASDLYNVFFEIDTSISCFGVLEGVFDNLTSYSSNVTYNNPKPIIMRNGIGGVTEVYESIYNQETLELVSQILLFKIPQEFLDAKASMNFVNRNQHSNKVVGKWQIDKITSTYESIIIDSCFQHYTLELSNNSKLIQSYQTGLKCSCNSLSLKKEHHLSFAYGYWKIIDTQLILFNSLLDDFIIWNYIIEYDKLKLFRGSDYIIELKKSKK